MENKITALKVQKRNPNRVNVYLDGVYAFGLARIVAAWLTVGQALTSTQLETLQSQDTEETAFQAALRLLNYRPRSQSEIRNRLVKKGYSEAVIEGTLERLRQAHLVDDAQFAQAWVDNQGTFRPRGKRALRMELRLKGIDEQDIQQALEAAGDEEELAYTAAQRQSRRLAGMEWKDFRLKLSQFLARRGFSYSTAINVVRKVWDETNLAGGQDLPGSKYKTENDQEADGWTQSGSS